MVMSLKNKVNSEIGEKSAELFSHSFNIAVIKVGAVGIKRLVKNNDFPFCIA